MELVRRDPLRNGKYFRLEQSWSVVHDDSSRVRALFGCANAQLRQYMPALLATTPTFFVVL